MTTKTNRPYVLHVDDVPEDLTDWEREVREQGKIDLHLCHPQDVSDTDLERASLILVDFRIERWPERSTASSLSLRPPNGLALASILQESAFDLAPYRPRAVALFTALINDVARELTPQPHIVSRARNLEWIFEKSGADNTLSQRANRVSELAEAINALPTAWPSDTAHSAEAALYAWLGLDGNASWSEAASRAISKCRPPIHEFAAYTAGVGVLRWALHKVLPYPTFLIDEAHLAARLRVPLTTLRQSLGTDQFEAFFSAANYRGQLKHFSGRRWWRAAVEQLLFDATDSPGDISALQAELRARIPTLDNFSTGRLFPVLDSNYRTKPDLALEGEVIEITPDDWPSFADEAWALKTDVDDNHSLQLVAIGPEV